MTARLRRPAAVGALVALVLLLGWWQLLWQPQGASLAAAHRQQQQESTNLFAVEQNIGHLKHLQTISPRLAALESRLSAAAPVSDEVDQFLISLTGLAQDANLTLGAISLAQPVATPAGLETIGVHFSVQGDYFAAQRFLDSLRAANRILVVDNLAESPARGSAKSTSTAVSLNLGAHLLTGLTSPPPAVAQALAAPPTTAAPSGIISGPVTKARNAVTAANASSSQLSSQANTIGGS